MGDANYPLGHYHCLEKSCWQKGFKGKRPEFSSEVRLAFCSTAQERVKTISLVQKNIIHLLVVYITILFCQRNWQNAGPCF